MNNQIPNPNNVLYNNNNVKPYMGNLTSGEIGNMAKAGMLGGEMVRRMIQEQENQMIQDNNSLQ